MDGQVFFDFLGGDGFDSQRLVVDQAGRAGGGDDYGFGLGFGLSRDVGCGGICGDGQAKSQRQGDYAPEALTHRVDFACKRIAYEVSDRDMSRYYDACRR